MDIDHKANGACENQMAIIFNKEKCHYLFKDMREILRDMAGKECDGQDRIKSKENP